MIPETLTGYETEGRGERASHEVFFVLSALLRLLLAVVKFEVAYVCLRSFGWPLRFEGGGAGLMIDR